MKRESLPRARTLGSSFVIIETENGSLSDDRLRALTERIWSISPFANENEETDLEKWHGALAKLATDTSAHVRLAVADNPTAPWPILATLSGDEKEYVKLAVAMNPSTPTQYLEQLSLESADLAALVASNPSTPVQLLRNLSKSKELIVLQRLAVNKLTPPDILLDLMEIDEEGINIGLASNPSLDEDSFTKLAKHEDYFPNKLKNALAKNESLPPSLIPFLKERGDVFTVAYIASNPSTDPEEVARIALKSPEKGVIRAEKPREAAAQNPNILPEALNALIFADDENLLVCVALNPALKPSWMSLLASRARLKNFKNVLRALGKNPSITPAVEKELLASGMGVEKALANNRHVSVNTLTTIYSKHYNDGIAMIQLAKNPSTPPRILEYLKMVLPEEVAGNPSTPTELLLRLARSEDCRIRSAVAGNESIPIELVDTLLVDKEFKVREKLASNNPRFMLQGSEDE